jgi:hypothetical protein
MPFPNCVKTKNMLTTFLNNLKLWQTLAQQDCDWNIKANDSLQFGTKVDNSIAINTNPSKQSQSLEQYIWRLSWNFNYSCDES